jgi:hypothetical protein
VIRQHLAHRHLDVRRQRHEQVDLALRPLVELILTCSQLVRNKVDAPDRSVKDHRVDPLPQGRERLRREQIAPPVEELVFRDREVKDRTGWYSRVEIPDQARSA